VGGHCIGVDPYYLTHKATEIGYHPEMILAGRRINDGMGAYVAQQILKLMADRRIMVADSKVLILGLTFKENCPDLRNSKVMDVVSEFKRFDARVDVYDPWVDADAAFHEYGLRPIKTPKPAHYDAIVLAVGHDEFKAMGVRNIRRWAKKTHVLYDVKYAFPRDQTDGRL
jgi:UDP-N-acetyl-D-galactosamine dehydrogenase